MEKDSWKETPGKGKKVNPAIQLSQHELATTPTKIYFSSPSRLGERSVTPKQRREVVSERLNRFKPFFSPRSNPDTENLLPQGPVKGPRLQEHLCSEKSEHFMDTSLPMGMLPKLSRRETKIYLNNAFILPEPEDTFKQSFSPVLQTSSWVLSNRNKMSSGTSPLKGPQCPPKGIQNPARRILNANKENNPILKHHVLEGQEIAVTPKFSNTARMISFSPVNESGPQCSPKEIHNPAERIRNANKEIKSILKHHVLESQEIAVTPKFSNTAPMISFSPVNESGAVKPRYQGECKCVATSPNARSNADKEAVPKIIITPPTPQKGKRSTPPRRLLRN